MNDSKTRLLALIEDYLERSGTAPSTFGAESIGDRSLVYRLRRGGNVTLATVDKVVEFINEMDEQDNYNGEYISLSF